MENTQSNNGRQEDAMVKEGEQNPAGIMGEKANEQFEKDGGNSGQMVSEGGVAIPHDNKEEGNDAASDPVSAGQEDGAGAKAEPFEIPVNPEQDTAKSEEETGPGVGKE